MHYKLSANVVNVVIFMHILLLKLCKHSQQGWLPGTGMIFKSLSHPESYTCSGQAWSF